MQADHFGQLLFDARNYTQSAAKPSVLARISVRIRVQAREHFSLSGKAVVWVQAVECSLDSANPQLASCVPSGPNSTTRLHQYPPHASRQCRPQLHTSVACLSRQLAFPPRKAPAPGCRRISNMDIASFAESSDAKRRSVSVSTFTGAQHRCGAGPASCPKRGGTVGQVWTTRACDDLPESTVPQLRYNLTSMFVGGHALEVMEAAARGRRSVGVCRFEPTCRLPLRPANHQCGSLNPVNTQ